MARSFGTAHDGRMDDDRLFQMNCAGAEAAKHEQAGG